jgi:acetoin utilization deacetylase AcuC-like enzyme
VPLGIMLEGGYELGALARSVAATLEVAAAQPAGPPELARHPLAADALGRLAQWWPMLAAA